MEETIRKLEKIIENPRRADKIVYTRGDIEDAIEGINRLKDRIKELEQDNNNLRNIIKKKRFSERYVDGLQEENRKLKEENFVMKDRLKFGYKGVTREEIERVEEENKKLKEELDYVRSIKDSAESTIKTQDERIRFLEQCLDNKEKVNKSLREENKRLSDFLECES